MVLVVLGVLIFEWRETDVLKISSLRGRKPTAKRRRVSDSDEEEEEGSEASAVEDEDDRSLKGDKGNRNSESMTSELSSEPLDILEDEAGEDEEAGPVSRTRAKVCILFKSAKLALDFIV